MPVAGTAGEAPAAPVPPAQTVAPAIPSTDEAALKAAVGKTATVRGKVTRAHAWDGGITFLNLDGRFTVVCFKKNLGKFPSPPEKIYEHKTIEVTGMVSLHKEKPQIEISSPDQVKVVDAAPAPAAPAAPPTPAVTPETPAATAPK